MTLREKYTDYKIILASKSPRRQNLFKGLGLGFEIMANDVDESFPSELKEEQAAQFIAKAKADAFCFDGFPEKTLVITADTIVCIDEVILNKPSDYEDAKKMLSLLSGRMHKVITGICLMTRQKSKVFSVETDVYFKELSSEEIEYYISNYKPFDKAGAYGAQEWIGYVGIEHISGSYFNVVGLPTFQLYEELMTF